LYGTTVLVGAYRQGNVFKLTPSNGGWTYTSLHDFTGGDGRQPFGQVTFDANGNLYGTATMAGANDKRRGMRNYAIGSGGPEHGNFPVGMDVCWMLEKHTSIKLY
jgi:hypothetical protein